MNDSTYLFRQVHPSWIEKQIVTSQAFRPTTKDDNKLSVSNGDMVTAEESWRKFTASDHRSTGVLAVVPLECTQCDLLVLPDPLENLLEHTVIDFSNKTKAEIRNAAKTLRDYAEARGWLYRL
jgi:hypothetical protein